MSFAVGLAILLIPNSVAIIFGLIVVEITSPLLGQYLGIQRNKVVENSNRFPNIILPRQCELGYSCNLKSQIFAGILFYYKQKDEKLN
ncbi:hypothetical protein CSC2_29460 [Clostridium zeae]|uniref:Permease n=1 Tax=Clostridium zeae TaxID=2759022 RepID=A0ABQ1ECC6_9CLOT|nr:hypothetical protein CSC2_29460 [Clostridium zeae]